MIITSLGNSKDIAKKLAKKLKCKYSETTVSSFPDGDLYLKFNTNLKKKKLVIVQSFQPHSDMSLFDIIFAANTAKDLGAKKVILVAPYLGYMRQDKRFNAGECISSKIMAKLLNESIDKLITIDPHIHRYKSLKDIFTIPTKMLTANLLIADHIQKKFTIILLFISISVFSQNYTISGYVQEESNGENLIGVSVLTGIHIFFRVKCLLKFAL